MNLDINWPAAASACTVIGLIAKGVHSLFSTALEKRDEAIKNLEEDLDKKKREHDIDVSALKASQKILFDKSDTSVDELHKYKLHVAETYVNREVLREQLLPINDALKEIRHDLQEERRK